MDKKKADITRKRNIELANKVQDLEVKLDELQKQLNESDYEFVKELIDEFDNVITSIKEKEQEYSELIAEVKELREFMNTVEFRDFWVKKAKKNFLKQYKND